MSWQLHDGETMGPTHAQEPGARGAVDRGSRVSGRSAPTSHANLAGTSLLDRWSDHGGPCSVAAIEASRLPVGSLGLPNAISERRTKRPGDETE